MQSKENTFGKAKTFVEICENLGEQQRSDLVSGLVSSLRICDRTARNWMRGFCRPISYSQMSDVAKVVRRVTGDAVKPLELFPSR